MAKNGRLVFSTIIFIFMFISSSYAIAGTTTMTEDNSREMRVDSSLSPSQLEPDTYTSMRDAEYVKEQMTLTPIFTPDNALDVYAAWLRAANSSIELQNQYLTQFDRDVEWPDDPHPIVKELVAAAQRGVSVRVQIREDSDSDMVGQYLDSFANIEVRWMGNQDSAVGDWLSNTHNKLVIIDAKVTLVSSINFSENSLTNNREAGMVVQNQAVTQYYLDFFNADWDDGEVPQFSPYQLSRTSLSSSEVTTDQYTSPTTLPAKNFTGIYNVSTYVNPDNADNHIFDYLKTAKESIYVSMYKIERQDFVDTLVDLKRENPQLDIQVLLSNSRTAGDGSEETQAAALEFTENFIPVYNSTENLNYYHNKYWIIDQKHTFIYSGNWSPRSVTPQETTYPSGDPNRDMGIAVHDAQDVADWIKEEVWDKDVEVATAYELPIGIFQNSFSQTEIVSGTVTLSGTVKKVNATQATYTIGSTTEVVTLDSGSFSIDFDTTTIDNGITSIELSVEDNSTGITYSDEVRVNVINAPSEINFRFLITEVMPNPEVVSDTEGEYIEITNSYPFSLLVEDWQVGDNNDLYTFPTDYEVPAYTSLILARDPTGFETGYGVTADIELGFSLTNGDDYVQLLDHDGEYVDVVAYGTDAPDGSETISADFEEGQSISRVALHIDTDQASDFVFASASPKATVPQVALDDTEGANPDLEDLPAPIMGLLVLVVVPLWRRRR